MADKYPVRLGYACINTDLRTFDIFTSRTLILSTIASRGLDYVKKLVVNNVDDLFKILIYNEAHGIRFFRISSAMFPHLGNPLAMPDGAYDITFVRDKLKLIGNYAKTHNHRLTMHPGQFVQLGSPRSEVVARSRDDLRNHVQLLQMMNYMPADGSVLIVHGGGTFGNKQQTLARWKQNYMALDPVIQSYIALENDENSYGVLDLLPVCEELGIPFCLDIFHNRISRDRVPITRRLVRRIFETWFMRGQIPKIHVSEQQANLRRGCA